ncbi:MAG: MbnP family protein [Lewinella sp.]
MKYYLPFLFLLLSSALSAQEVRVVFQPILRGESLQLAEEGGAAGAKTVVEVLRFYLSDVALLNEGLVVSTSNKHHHLLDDAKPKTMQLPLSVPEGTAYDALRFTIGVDSLTAASGAFGADLDPTNGMYWTWRSGYINFKLEGTSPNCPAWKNRFQFHVGGFQGPFNSEREVLLEVIPGSTIPIRINLDHFFAQTDISKDYQIMSPNEEAMGVADLVVELFEFSTTAEKGR